MKYNRKAEGFLGSMVSVMSITVVLMLFLSILPYALGDDDITQDRIEVSAFVENGIIYPTISDIDDSAGFRLRVRIIGTDVEYGMSEGTETGNMKHYGGTLLLRVDERSMNAEYGLTVFGWT